MKLITILLMLPLCSLAEIPDRFQAWDNCSFINEGWLYLENDLPEPPCDAEGFVAVTLPHTWNAEDAQRTDAYRRSGGWYRKELHFTESEAAQRNYLRFGAAGQMAKVYCNGKLLSTHIGGYAAFTVELENAVAGGNIIDVYVSNAHNPDIAPLSADFTFYGGLYRGVQLLSTGPTCISRTRAGGPGVELTTTYDPETGTGALSGTAYLEGIPGDACGLKLVVSVAGATEEFPVSKKTAFSLELGAVDPWTPGSPRLYPVEITLKNKGAMLDTVRQRTGFRSFRFDQDKGFYLNGEPLFLKGVNRHQDFDRKGNAVSDADHHLDIALMKELGVNWLRLAHYQQDDYMLQLCDEMGLLVWEEIPFVNAMTLGEAFEENLATMINDMITQHRNHASVILWGIGNEYILGQRAYGEEKVAMMERLEAYCKRLDPSRNTVSAAAYTDGYSDGGFVQITDVIGYNLYPGWYGGTPEQIADVITHFHELDPNKPFILSEWGAGSDQRIHSETPRIQDFSEEWQCYYIEEYLDAFDTLPFLAGVNYWNFADFGSAKRGDSIPHVNQKGLVNFRREKKDAFYLVKARWSAEPVIHIAGQSWTNRWGDTPKSYRVYSNCDSVELLLNGQSLDRQEKRMRYEFSVPFSVGENTLVAKGNKDGREYTDTLVVQYSLTNPDPSAILATSDNATDPAENAVDGKTYTRFSYQGSGRLDLDLRRSRLLAGVDIRFYKGAQRDYPYRVQLSVDGRKWTTVAKGTSEKEQTVQIRFDATHARYIRIHGDGQVGKENAFVSYEEVVPVDAEKEKSIYESVGPQDDSE